MASKAFTWTFIALSGWLMAGAYLDAWHHHHLARPETSFLTLYHLPLYSGVTAIGVLLGIRVVRNLRRHRTWTELLPGGYGVSLFGTFLFGIAGGLDLLWHLRFGIEVSVAALFSPTHILLMLAGGLIVSGPLRAAMRGGETRAPWAAVIAAALTLSMFTFFMQFDQPYIDRWAAGLVPDPRGPIWMEEELGMFGLLLYAAMFAGFLVLLLGRFTLRVGSVTLILALNAALLSMVQGHTELVLAALLGGGVGDALLYLLKPSALRSNALHAFAFLAPAAMVGSYLLTLALTTGVWWPTNIWTGAIPIAGIVGWSLSFVALPEYGARARAAQAGSLQSTAPRVAP